MLEHSLHGAALIALGLQEQPDAVTHPWHLILQHPHTTPCPLPTGTRITQVYDDADEELPILGGPGSGKTTLLLELARDLLDRTQADEQHPVPVVFNLSLWVRKQQRFGDRLVEELNQKYQMPCKLGQALVDARHRTACIETITTYRQEHETIPERRLIAVFLDG